MHAVMVIDINLIIIHILYYYRYYVQDQCLCTDRHSTQLLHVCRDTVKKKSDRRKDIENLITQQWVFKSYI